jgi:prepilin-type processing-associated H-X9-DG protein
VDGTSGTVAFGEVLIGDNSSAANNSAEMYTNLVWPVSPNEGNGVNQVAPDCLSYLQTYQASCDAQRKSKANETNDSFSYWASGRMHHGPLQSMLNTPNSSHADCSYYNAQGQSGTFRSRHSGGVNVMFADGSVRFVKASISQNTWWSIGTRDRGEVVSADSY